MKNWRKAVGAALLLAAVAAVAGVTGGTASTTAAQKNCSFQLRIGDVLPFTGGLAAYGANLDRAVKLAVDMDNATLKRLKLSKMSVKLVASEDGQTQAAASTPYLPSCCLIMIWATTMAPTSSTGSVW